MKGCGVKRGGKYADGLVQRYGALMGNRQAQIDKDGAVIPGHDTEGSDDVDVKVTRGEAILPVRTVDAMGGPMAVSDMIHATNGKPPAGVRRGGKYADGATNIYEGVSLSGMADAAKDKLAPLMPAPGSAMRTIDFGETFKPGGWSKPLSIGTVAPKQDYGNEGRSVPTAIGVQKQPVAPTTTPAAAPTAPVATPTVPGADATMPARDPNAPVGDPRLTALGVRGDWKPMTEAAGTPIKDATIYSNKAGNSFAGYGTQTPEKQAADAAAADAAHRKTMDMYASESQARLGARIAQARSQGEDAYADSLEKQQTQQNAASLAGAQAKAALAGSEGIGALRTAQAGEATAQAGKAGQELEQAKVKQGMTDEYLKADTAPDRRKVLAAALGIKPDSGWQISTTFGPPDAMGQPIKSTIAHRTTASGELETRDLSGGAQQPVTRAQVDAAAKAKGITEPSKLKELYKNYGV